MLNRVIILKRMAKPQKNCQQAFGGGMFGIVESGGRRGIVFKGDNLNGHFCIEVILVNTG